MSPAGERRRLVSLVPSATETLLALGADVVACTRFCKQPGLATVGGTKNPDLAAIVALGPDRVVVDVEENRREDADALTAAGIELIVTAVRTVDDAREAVDRLADGAGVDRRPLEPWIAPAPSPGKGTVLVPIWRRPWMAIGAPTYGASLLAQLGWTVVAPRAAEPYPTFELAEIAAAAPDVIAVPSEPYAFGDPHVDELAQAWPTARIQRVDGEDLFWWGIRTPGAAARLAVTLG